MSHAGPSHDPIFGYLTTLESTEHGYFGGYLLVSALGRPLEFHCTVPVRPNRAQEILYGPTLQPYLLGEQIGGTLLAEAKLKAQLVLTDKVAMLCLRSQLIVPLVLVGRILTSSDSTFDDDASPLTVDGHLHVAQHELQLAPGFEPDVDVARRLLIHLAERVDLAEPFERIHDAIREAQRIGGRGQGSHGQAA